MILKGVREGMMSGSKVVSSLLKLCMIKAFMILDFWAREATAAGSVKGGGSVRRRNSALHRAALIANESVQWSGCIM